MRRFLIAISWMTLLPVLGAASGEHGGSGPALTAPYGMSELDDGWSIMAISGLGTQGDPVIIDAEVYRTSSVTLQLTASRPINPFAHPRTHSTGTIHFVIRTKNASGHPWVALEFELQEVRSQPSVYGDGLSFDQRRENTDVDATSDAFSKANRDFEPFDRILFSDGAVSPGETARFRLLVTDLTPAEVFYLQLDPRIPAS